MAIMNWTKEECRKAFFEEVNKIHNTALREKCVEMMDKLPNYFWEVPASSSGKYHPECDLGDGGLIRHSLMVNKCGLDLLFAEIFGKNTKDGEDMVRVACLFHDAFKSGKVADDGTYSSHTVFEHPRLSAEWLDEELPKETRGRESIISAVYSHMGKWNEDKYGNGKPLPKPKSPFEKLVHTADYMASRKYIKWLE